MRIRKGDLFYLLEFPVPEKGGDKKV